MLPEYIDNDVATPNDAVLWRYIDSSYVKADGTASSAAYRTKHCSMYVVAAQAGPGVTTIAALRAKFPGVRFQTLTGKQARDAGCMIVPVPDDDGDDSHREVCPADGPHRTLRKEADKLKVAATWVEGDDPNNPQGAAAGGEEDAEPTA